MFGSSKILQGFVSDENQVRETIAKLVKEHDGDVAKLCEQVFALGLQEGVSGALRQQSVAYAEAIAKCCFVQDGIVDVRAAETDERFKIFRQIARCMGEEMRVDQQVIDAILS